MVIIKDLSQYSGKPEQHEIVRGLFESAYGSGETVYLVAANDGQLLRTLRRYSEANESGKRAEEAIRNMLKDDASDKPGLWLDMWNLSRQPHDETFERLLNDVVEHEGWSACEGCEIVSSCPIQRNRDLLRQSGPVGLRARLRDMIRMAADNDMHLPIRQVLLVIVNTLLGVHGLRSPLLSCAAAESLARNGKTSESNPYDNVFGLNLGPDRKTYRRSGSDEKPTT